MNTVRMGAYALLLVGMYGLLLAFVSGVMETVQRVIEWWRGDEELYVRDWSDRRGDGVRHG